MLVQYIPLFSPAENCGGEVPEVHAICLTADAEPVNTFPEFGAFLAGGRYPRPPSSCSRSARIARSCRKQTGID